jgi:hypothetical protein
MFQQFRLRMPGMDKYIEFCADGNNVVALLFSDKLFGLDFWSIHIGRSGLES